MDPVRRNGIALIVNLREFDLLSLTTDAFLPGGGVARRKNQNRNIRLPHRSRTRSPYPHMKKSVLALALFAFVMWSEIGRAQKVMVEIPVDVAKQIAWQAEASNVTAIEALGVQDVASLEEAVPVRMRDGARLSATIILPNEDAARRRKFSTILIKTPYSAVSEWTSGFRKELFARLVRQGYALVAVNERGTRWSEGEYHWLRGARSDGYDILSWVSAQPWSNGRVGTFGCSSSAEGQIPLASLNHPAHKAMVPIAGATAVGEIPGYDDQGIWYAGGVPQLFWSWWFQSYGHHDRPLAAPGISEDERLRLVRSYSAESTPPFRPKLAQHLPSADILKVAGSPRTDFDDLIRLAPADEYWKQYDFLRTGDATRVPALHIDSWYDLVGIYPTTKMYEYLSRNSPNQYLVVGPTQHCMQGTESQRTMIGERNVGDARFDYVSLIVSFFDYYVENDGRGKFPGPNIRFYLMGSGTWETASTWPVASKPYRLYLRSEGRANSIWGDGALTTDRPHGADVADVYESDPLNPVPSKGSSCCAVDMSVDQREVEARNDVLVYTSEVFEEPLAFVGYVKARLFLQSSAPDTDLMFKLVDVYPDGRALNLFDSAQRVRYRNGIRNVAQMRPGQVYEVNLDRAVTAIRLPKGHRLRIEIASTNFPAYERNLNTGGNNFDEAVARAVTNSIIHGVRHSSYIELPLYTESAAN
ncbi:MAG: CocE/NonD family hydrolase [Gammaproteobacteria bacterium]